MRLAFRIDLRSTAPRVALCAAIAVVALPYGVNAQESVQAQTANAGTATLASAAPAAVTTPDVTVTNATNATEATTPISTIDAAANPAADNSQLVSAVLSIPADAPASYDFALDDQVLSRQRGGAVGMLMVAATPQMMRDVGSSGSNVTLWDEIAPPTPMPIPVDASRSAQGNTASYQRK